MLDYLIQHATVYNGIQTDPRKAAVGIADGRIAYIGAAAAVPARRTIDAKGLYLCPGFIDTHASTGLGYLLPRASDHKIHQGVTTEVVGNCGSSDAPIGPCLTDTVTAACAEKGCPFDWRTLGEWLERLDAYGLPINAGTHVGHSALRAGIAGDRAEIDAGDQAAMAETLDTAMRDGALGLSTGLVYAPGSFASTGEILELARVAARHGGMYVSHIRNEREGLEDAVDEVIEISRGAGLPALISHLKAAERPNWGKLPRVIEKIESARRQKIEVGFEVYPYTAVSTRLRTYIPKEAIDDGVAGMVERLATAEWRARARSWLLSRQTDFAAMRLITESLPGCRGLDIREIAQRRRGSREDGIAADTVIDILLADAEAWIVYTCLAEGDLEAAILWPDSVICSDSWSYPVNALNQIGDPHPRTFGAFTRFLERFSLKGTLPFGEAVRKITSLPAHWLGLSDRGRIREGAWADLVLLDPSRLREKATFDEPRQTSEGTQWVWVNGRPVLEEGELADRRPGHVLRGRRRHGDGSLRAEA